MSTRNFYYDNVEAIAIRGLGSGEIRVRESNDRSVSGTVSSENDHYLDQISLDESDGRVQFVFPNHFNGGAELEVEVPAGIVFEATTGSANVSAEVALGPTRITTGSGDIALDAVAELQATTGSGDISVQTIGGSAGQVNSGSGDISIGGTGAVVQAKSASGDLTVGELWGALRANTASGDISVGRTTGSVEGRSSSGDINIAIGDDLPAWLDVNTSSGEVLIGLDAGEQPEDGQPYASIRATTASGDISVSRA